MKRTLSILFCAMAGMLGHCSSAIAWETRTVDGSVFATNRVAEIEFSFNCLRTSPGRLTVSLSGVDLPSDFKGILVWFELPDGRNAKHSVDMVGGNAGWTGEMPVSELMLAEFASAAKMRVDAPLYSRTLFESDLKGTSAARAAFRENCGF